MDNKILVFGKGFIGNMVHEALDCPISEKIIKSFNDAQEEIKKHNPKIIINCIGQTGQKNVDDCELDKDATLSANAFVPIILAEAAIRNAVKLIHIGTGCIYHFDYSKSIPIDEEQIPDFFDLFYSRTKIYTDMALKVLSSQFDILILRPRIPLDKQPHPKNLLTKLISYKKIIDIPNSVIYLPDFIQALKHLIKINARGIYNVVNKGALRYSKLLDVYKKYVPSFEYEIIDYRNLKLTRTNLVLSTEKLEKSGFKIRGIEEVLEECVQAYLKY
jgi:dTDP-4-dehydrorhamnose reductase